jgi:translation initiation factor 6 (eIF-6)
MKKLLVLGFCLLILSACNKKFDSNLLNYVKENLKNNKGTLKLGAYKEVNWNTMYVLGPYTSTKQLDAVLKPYQKEILATGIDTDDQICLVMLFNDKALVSQSVFDRKTIDFERITRFVAGTKIKPISRDSANFSYQRPKEYTPYVLQ